ncbi:MAG: M48 family metallopeptidase, partial [Muribaculaceae bacterium]|nr:M48 family metallopeptidase [Muribaculaceae bacterium]
DLQAPEVIDGIARMMKSIARYLAPAVLLPRAADLADSVGVRPAEWRLTSGRKTLGRCDSRRVISLSVVLVFMPQELRDYVVYHELAHLTEMNHSPKFHALCDRYCNGREAELERRLKQFRFPLP